MAKTKTLINLAQINIGHRFFKENIVHRCSLLIFFRDPFCGYVSPRKIVKVL